MRLLGDSRPGAGAGAAALAAFLLAAAAAAQTLPDSVAYDARFTSGNKLGLALTNYGLVGNGFTSRSPSFEYPLGSGYEHMSRGGLWFGAYTLTDTGAALAVSTAIVDEVQGYNGIGDTEFTPASRAIVERSRIQNNRLYSPDALSDQDLIAFYSDMPAGYHANQEQHQPLRILVRQSALSFQLPAAESFVVMRYTITNLGPPLREAWAAIYVQLVSGNKSRYSTWPPGATSGPGSWYFRSRIQYDYPRRMYQERFCASNGNCLASLVPPWAAVKLLRVSPGSIADRHFNLHWWSFSPGDVSRDEDRERYALMSTPDSTTPAACEPGIGTCSPIGLISVGPFSEIATGDSVQVDFAFLGGEDDDALPKHADYAQFAADIDYHLPTAPPSPRLHIETGSQRVDFFWDDSPEGSVDPASQAPGGRDFEGYRLYLGEDRDAPGMFRQLDIPDTTGFNTGFDAVRLASPRVIDGVTYRYHARVDHLRDGHKYWGAVTSYDTGDQTTSSLESSIGQNKFLAVPGAAPGESPVGITVFPNPYIVETGWDQGRLVRDHYLWFAGLPRRCMLRIYTLSGDLVLERRFNGDTYAGDGVRGLYDPAHDVDTHAPVLSGSSFAWDLITRLGQAAATGLYIWSVQDLDGERYSRGKFLIVKSDREP